LLYLLYHCRPFYSWLFRFVILLLAQAPLTVTPSSPRGACPTHTHSHSSHPAFGSLPLLAAFSPLQSQLRGILLICTVKHLNHRTTSYHGNGEACTKYIFCKASWIPPTACCL